MSDLPALDPFGDIDRKINLDNVEPNLQAVIDKLAEDLEMLSVKTIDDNNTDDDDDEEVYKIHSGAFDVFDDDFVEKTENM